jgi:hypothetical protein
LSVSFDTDIAWLGSLLERGINTFQAVDVIKLADRDGDLATSSWPPTSKRRTIWDTC